MQHDGPIRVIVEIHPTQVLTLATQLVQRLTTTSQPATLHVVMDKTQEAPASANPSDDDDAVSRISRTSDPPRTTPNGHLPVLPLDLAMKYVLGPLCRRGHDYEESGKTLRSRSGTHNCIACARLYEATRPPRVHGRRRGQRRHEKARAPAVPVTTNGQHPVAPPAPPPIPIPLRPTPVVLPPIESTNGRRPELPAHLAEMCFLSPVTCEVATHRYRGSPFTLRFRDDEDCCQCVAHTRTLKAGD